MGGTGFAVLSAKVRRFFARNRKRGAVVGVSGGVDSALACILLSKALGPKRVSAFYLPYFRDAEAEANAAAVARSCGVRLQKVSIRPAVDALAGVLKCDARRKGNLMARIRMAVLYDAARRKNALVAGTGNKSEFSIGYFTKFGDGGADFLPIGGLLKREVRSMALEAGVPARIAFQTPSAGLWPGQSDERELGMAYADLDGILELVGRREIPVAVKKFGRRKVSKVLALTESSAHKREKPVIL